MRFLISCLWFSLGFLLVFLHAFPAYPHSGGLDRYGCHHDRKRGGYHCHRGQFAGQFFGSKEEMLQKLKEKPPSKEAKAKKE